MIRRCFRHLLPACAIASTLFTPAAAVEFDAAIGKKATGRCHMDYCSFFIIQTALPLAVLKDGTLFAISDLAWGAEYKPRPEAQNDYAFPPIKVEPKTPDAYIVFCSKTRPRIFFYGEGKWDTLALRPGDSSAVAGAFESAYAHYWAACHHYVGGDTVATELANKLGYRLAPDYGTGDKLDPVKQPSDLMR